MTETQFWDFINQARAEAGHDLEVLWEQLTINCESLSDTELIELHRWVWTFLAQSYQSKLWAAAFLINGGCSDDGFDYFRGWLIAQGKTVFFAALENPDSLADYLPQIPDWQPYEELEFENMLGLGGEAYNNRHGEYPKAGIQFPKIKINWNEDDDEFFSDNFPYLSALMNTDD